ncbi:pe38 protein [Thysanoplusia orichalcea nucleopolyhedrovirus]|uniref:Pe38 protein n=1 Tax=Thysanoplusia orichalcea nucleopolyhedrovirus TaxID=101850 RepID=L0CLH7_9ABAC|nr:pe38 protein [Thysanoplusia orichalcea nucleopolyhedrovirus]AGA16300.1 pe38 protein [Thysanoplusia orichalcea nucleopolyhedrovirus]
MPRIIRDSQRRTPYHRSNHHWRAPRNQRPPRQESQRPPRQDPPRQENQNSPPRESSNLQQLHNEFQLTVDSINRHNEIQQTREAILHARQEYRQAALIRARQRQTQLRAIQQKQEKMLAELNSEPVIDLKFECAVCMETYSHQSNDTCPFLVPTTCDHGFCFKCAIDLQGSAMNIPNSTICCPMCNKQIRMWRSCKPGSVVTCKFYKKTQEKVPPVQQYRKIIKVLRERSVITTDDDIPDTQTELAVLEAEMQEEKKLNSELMAKNQQLTEEKGQLNQQIQELQNQINNLTFRRNITVDQQINYNNSAPANLNERFRSLVYSTVSELLIEDRIQSIQNYVYAETSATSCNVNVNVNFGFENTL